MFADRGRSPVDSQFDRRKFNSFFRDTTGLFLRLKIDRRKAHFNRVARKKGKREKRGERGKQLKRRRRKKEKHEKEGGRTPKSKEGEEKEKERSSTSEPISEAHMVFLYETLG